MSGSSPISFINTYFGSSFEVAVTNTHILCKNFSDMTFSDVKAFRAELAKALIGDYCSRKQRGRPYLSLPQSKRFCPTHFPVRGSDKQHPCYYCSNYRGRHSTVWCCSDCKLSLCHNGK